MHCGRNAARKPHPKMSSLSREKGYYKERALRRLGELIPRETEAPNEIENMSTQELASVVMGAHAEALAAIRAEAAAKEALDVATSQHLDAQSRVEAIREKPDEPPSPKSAPHDAAPTTAQIDLPPGLEPPGAFGGGTPGTLGAGTLGGGRFVSVLGGGSFWFPASDDDDAAAMDVDDEEAALRREIAAVRAEREAVDAEIAKLGGGTMLGGGPHLSPERREWHITPNDLVSEQLQVLFSHSELKDGDHIVFAPGTYQLDSTVLLYGHEGNTQIFRNITLRGTGGDPTKVILWAEEDYGLDHLFYVCREPGGPHPTPITYSGPEHPVVHFSGLTFRNDHLTQGRNAMVCAVGDVDVVLEDCRVLRPHDKKGGKRQNMLGKFRQPMYPGISFEHIRDYADDCGDY